MTLISIPSAWRRNAVAIDMVETMTLPHPMCIRYTASDLYQENPTINYIVDKNPGWFFVSNKLTVIER